MYSAAIAPYLKPLPDALAARAGVPALRPGVRRGDPPLPHRRRPRGAAQHFLGSGLALWLVWQVACMAGFFAGNLIPSAWSLEFAVPLCFIALVAPLFRDVPSVLAAHHRRHRGAGAEPPADEAQPDRRRRHRHRHRARWPILRGSDGSRAEALGGHLRGRRAQLPVAAVVHRASSRAGRCRRCWRARCATFRPRC